MNANFGLIATTEDRSNLLSPLPREVKSWGGEDVPVGSQRYALPGVSGVELEAYPVTSFILQKLPESWRDANLEYLWMTGPGLDQYQEWVREHSQNASARHALEDGLLIFCSKARCSAVMFAPEGDRLEMFLDVAKSELVDLLRKNVVDLAASPGFLSVLAP
jgi:hypothetical protein